MKDLDYHVKKVGVSLVANGESPSVLQGMTQVT